MGIMKREKVLNFCDRETLHFLHFCIFCKNTAVSIEKIGDLL